MAEERCPYCSGAILRTDKECPHCHRGLTGKALLENPPHLAGSTATNAAPARSAPAGSAFVLRKLLWSVATLAMMFFALDGFFTFEAQTGAPQQAAAAAAACFHMIAPYVIARGLDQLLRGPDALG